MKEFIVVYYDGNKNSWFSVQAPDLGAAVQLSANYDADFDTADIHCIFERGSDFKIQISPEDWGTAR